MQPDRLFRFRTSKHHPKKSHKDSALRLICRRSEIRDDEEVTFCFSSDDQGESTGRFARTAKQPIFKPPKRTVEDQEEKRSRDRAGCTVCWSLLWFSSSSGAGFGSGLKDGGKTRREIGKMGKEKSRETPTRATGLSRPDVVGGFFRSLLGIHLLPPLSCLEKKSLFSVVFLLLLVYRYTDRSRAGSKAGRAEKRTLETGRGGRRLINGQRRHWRSRWRWAGQPQPWPSPRRPRGPFAR